jgi:hypothetical protein
MPYAINVYIFVYQLKGNNDKENSVNSNLLDEAFAFP